MLVTVLSLLLQVYGWYVWKVTSEVMEAFQRAGQNALERADSGGAP